METSSNRPWRLPLHLRGVTTFLAVATATFMASAAYAHGVAEGDQAFIETINGPAPGAFLYLGAKHSRVSSIW